MTLKPQQVSTAIVSDMYWVSSAEVDLAAVRDHFTVTARLPVFGTNKTREVPIPTYREDAHSRPGLIGLPLAAGEAYCPADTLVEDLSDGIPFDCWTRLPDPNHPSAAPGQAEFMDLAYEATQRNYSNLFKAETGTGKTVVGLGLAAQLRVSTLVLVPTVQLMKQWVQQAQDILGVDRKDIGIVQGPKCQWQKPFVVGMMKSVAQKQYPPEFYRAFGHVEVDELHNTGAITTSRIQGLFNSRYKTGLSATDKRRDGADKVYHSYYGKPAFERSMPGVPTKLYVASYTGPTMVNTRPDLVLAALTTDHERNRIFARLAAKWYDDGHDVLLISDHVDHCYRLGRYMKAMGVPANDIGIYTNMRPVNGVEGDRQKTPQDYLDWCKEVPPIFIATYGMFKEGLDVPRLGVGMDCTPRSDLEQVLGRVRRRQEGRKYSMWFSLRDRTTPKLDGKHYARMRSVSHLDGVSVVKTTVADLLKH